jgi:hypothetical protein
MSLPSVCMCVWSSCPGEIWSLHCFYVILQSGHRKIRQGECGGVKARVPTDTTQTHTHTHTHKLTQNIVINDIVFYNSILIKQLWMRSFSEGVWDFSFLRNVQPSSGAHSASYSMGAGGSFLGMKVAGREVDYTHTHTHTSGPVIKYWWSFTITPATRLYRVDKENYSLHKEMLSVCPTADVRRNVKLVFLLYFI